MRSIHAYTTIAETLAATLEEISQDEKISDDEKIVQADGVSRAIEKIAEAFEADNPRGFDKNRFLDDVYGPEEPDPNETPAGWFEK